MICPRFPRGFSAPGPFSGRPGEWDTEQSDLNRTGSAIGTGRLGSPGNGAEPGPGLGAHRPGSGNRGRSRELSGSRREKQDCGAVMRCARGWVGARSSPSRAQPASILVLIPAPSRAAPGRVSAPHFRCNARSRGSPRTARNEGGAGHDALGHLAETLNAHRKSSSGARGERATEEQIWGQMGGNRVHICLCCSRRPRGPGAILEGALTSPLRGRAGDAKGPAGTDGARAGTPLDRESELRLGNFCG